MEPTRLPGLRQAGDQPTRGVSLMARFILVVRPDGRAFLTCDERLSEQESHALEEQLRGWEAGTWPVAIIPDCRVVQVRELDIRLDQPILADPIGSGL